ncbi:helix-turn-helix transcriptional regulator [Streptomyces fractus]|uniref:helix-turn-helix transcriptional regulator n=1 Tax=Streptomyces fractus TaxID=641806 RepID=UPI003CF042F1
MDNRNDIREFLASRRARITPQQAGLPAFGGGKRRVPGLRREEVAMLAGVSVDYYGRLERGELNGVSDSVLDALAGALQLDEAERSHLFDLARVANTVPRARARAARRKAAQQVRPGVQYMLDAMTDSAAVVLNNRLDVIAGNQLGKALYAPLFAAPQHGANIARLTFLDPRAADIYPNWDAVADNTVAALRTEAGRTPYDKGLTDLVGELSTRSEEFRVRWAAHHVYLHRCGTKQFHHPQVGDLTLLFEVLPLPSDPGLSMTAYVAEPGTPAHDSLKLLASWAATRDNATALQEEDEQEEASSADAPGAQRP